MKINLSTQTWKPIDMPTLKKIEGTREIYELSRSKWPKWAESSTQFNRIILCSNQAHNDNQITTSSTGMIARLITERIDLKDAPKIYNYNIYMIAETTDGRVFQSPPLIPKDPIHHSSSPSTWFNNLGTPL